MSTDNAKNFAKMPEAVENGAFKPSLDQQGAIWIFIDDITWAYLDFARHTKGGTLLEIAAAYGHIVIKALEAGATQVFANEVDVRHLKITKSRIQRSFKPAHLLSGRIS